MCFAMSTVKQQPVLGVLVVDWLKVTWMRQISHNPSAHLRRCKQNGDLQKENVGW